MAGTKPSRKAKGKKPGKKAARKAPPPTKRKTYRRKKTTQRVRTTGVGETFKGALMAVDARRISHIPPPLPLGPYTVVRGRNVFSVATSNTGQQTVLLVSPHTLANVGANPVFNTYATPVIGTIGAGTNIPGSTFEGTWQDAIAVPYAAATLGGNLCSASLHALTVVVSCFSTAVLADGAIYMGALNQRVARTRFATWNDLAANLLNRREMTSTSAFHVLSDPVAIHAYPVDTVDWAAQRPLVTGDLTTFSNNATMDSLCQLAFVWPPTTASVIYTLTVYTEWRMNFTDPALASTASGHMAAPLKAWNDITAMGQATGGFMDSAAKVAAGVAGAASSTSSLLTQLGISAPGAAGRKYHGEM